MSAQVKKPTKYVVHLPENKYAEELRTNCEKFYDAYLHLSELFFIASNSVAEYNDLKSELIQFMKSVDKQRLRFIDIPKVYKSVECK